MSGLRYFSHSNGSTNDELYGIVDTSDNWVIKPILPDFIGAEALAERMNICAQLAAGEIKVTVPVLARLGIDGVVYENFHVYA